MTGEEMQAGLTRAGLNLIQQALSIYDSDLKLALWNRRFVEIFALPDHLATVGARFDDIAPVTTLPRVRCPVLLAHGLHDDTVPFAEAVRLAASRPGTTLIQVDAGHDLSDALPQAHKAFESFLNAPGRNRGSQSHEPFAQQRIC